MTEVQPTRSIKEDSSTAIRLAVKKELPGKVPFSELAGRGDGTNRGVVCGLDVGGVKI